MLPRRSESLAAPLPRNMLYAGSVIMGAIALFYGAHFGHSAALCGVPVLIWCVVARGTHIRRHQKGNRADAPAMIE